MQLPYYFDHNATTACDPRVVEAMLPWFTDYFGNASSNHHPYGWVAENAVEEAREKLAGLIGAEPKEILFTSGATEAINLAIRGVLGSENWKDKHLITVQTEHKAVLDTCKMMEEAGVKISYLPVNSLGELDLGLLEENIRKNTVMIVAMLANNETGLIHPVSKIAQIAHQYGVLLLSDAVQAVGKIPLNVHAIGIDIMPFSAHKFYGPKGVGALFIRSGEPKINLKAQITGGGQERNIRSGTLNVPGIVGFAKTAEIALEEMEEDTVKLSYLRDKLQTGLLKMEGCRINGNPKSRLPHVANMSFKGVDANKLLIAVNKKIAVSSGSACSTITNKPSHVLKAMSVPDELALSSLRFGLGKTTTIEQVNYAIGYIHEVIEKLRSSQKRIIKESKNPMF